MSLFSRVNRQFSSTQFRLLSVAFIRLLNHHVKTRSVPSRAHWFWQQEQRSAHDVGRGIQSGSLQKLFTYLLLVLVYLILSTQKISLMYVYTNFLRNLASHQNLGVRLSCKRYTIWMIRTAFDLHYYW